MIGEIDMEKLEKMLKEREDRIKREISAVLNSNTENIKKKENDKMVSNELLLKIKKELTEGSLKVETIEEIFNSGDEKLIECFRNKDKFEKYINENYKPIVHMITYDKAGMKCNIQLELSDANYKNLNYISDSIVKTLDRFRTSTPISDNNTQKINITPYNLNIIEIESLISSIKSETKLIIEND